MLKVAAVSIGTELKVFNSICISTLLYGLESLPLSEARLHALDSFAYFSYRKILGYKPLAHVSYMALKFEALDHGVQLAWQSVALKSRRLSNFWHFGRHHLDIQLWGPDNAKRPRDRPAFRLYRCNCQG